LFFYTAYGLGICSVLPFPELALVEQMSPGIAIQVRKLGGLEQATPSSSACFLGETPGVGMFLVRDGNEIIIDPVPGVDESLLRTIILGPILAVLLRQRGLAVLHASSVATNTYAVAFIGQSGWGKSTLAEALYGRGYSVVTDDVMAVHLDGDYPQVFPGYPSIKLFPDTAAFLGCSGRATHAVHSHTEKRAHSAALRFPNKPLPLRRMYVLAFGECNEIAPLSPREVVLELVRNSRAVSLLRDADSLKAHLHQCARLAAKVPVFRLQRRPALSALPDVVRLIEEDLTENA
jgi:hypothetical protein